MREPLIKVAVGFKGGGKTYREVQDIAQYLRTQKDRKVIIFDTNDEVSYQMFKPIRAIDIPKLKPVSTVRRVTPYNTVTGDAFTLDEKAQMAFYLLHTVKEGLLVLDDINNYLLDANQMDFISKITTNRQPGLDISLNLQSFSAIMPRLWANTNYLRVHYTAENLDRIKQKLPDFELYSLVQIMMQQRVKAGFKYCFMYVDVQRNKMIGFSQNEESTTEPCTLRTVTEAELVQASAYFLDKEPLSREVQKFVAKKLYYIE